MMSLDFPSRIDLETARQIIDFSGGRDDLTDLAQVQLEGAVALYNKINDPDCQLGYLADEVGMGKTYIALGVIALMRYFNPSLRVLFVCPGRNVQDKWQREYLSFISLNVRTSQFRIRTPDGRPAAPLINCNDLKSLLAATTTGYYADIFVRKDSFSLAMVDPDTNDENLKANPFLNSRYVKDLRPYVPALNAKDYLSKYREEGENALHLLKGEAKDFNARVLNRAMPDFDLIVIDEAHNFKHPFNNSYRNRVLSQVLGTYLDDDENPLPGLRRHINKALLLSATPYDRNIEQLRNQLRMVGRHGLMAGVAQEDKQQIITTLRSFMVRRLNTIKLNNEPHSRNQYRVEARSGEGAEIGLQNDEQRLVTALVQKKVGEVLGRHGDSPSFQVGLLSSFESYADRISEPVQFDGDPDDRDASDAEDRHLIGHLVDSWQNHQLGTSLPHPKMDSVSQSLAHKMLHENRKQLIFVRRVKSVKEFKQKLDEAYDRWLISYLQQQVAGKPEAQQTIDTIVSAYRSVRRKADLQVDDLVEAPDDDSDKRMPPKEDNLFNWFFRGDTPGALETLSLKPDLLAKGVVAGNQQVGVALEINWARHLQSALSSLFPSGLQPADLTAIQQHAHYRKKETTDAWTSEAYAEKFHCAQLAFLEYLVQNKAQDQLKPLRELLKRSTGLTYQTAAVPLPLADLNYQLATTTLFNEWQTQGLLGGLFRSLENFLNTINDTTSTNDRAIRRVEAHRQLIVTLVRNGHNLIDLFLARVLIGDDNLDESRRLKWLQQYTALLKAQGDNQQQGNSSGFSSWTELNGLSRELDAIIKANVPGVLQEKHPDEFRKYIAWQLTPLAPIIGASGETGSGAQRSNQARKFRMPGYPLALVSTDVFQEGEDLHLFCDSVTHYGLSASPVSIEQKIGRVDRVGALAHRNLAAFREETPLREHMIQVGFPHVKESIEYLQVRQTCHNINEFIRSLDKDIADDTRHEDRVFMTEAVTDATPIPEQILTRLMPHYQPDALPDNELKDLHNRIQTESKAAEARVQSVKAILEKELQVNWEANGFKGTGSIKIDGERKELDVELTAARGSGYLLVSLTDPIPLTVNLGCIKDVFKVLKEYGWNDWCRPCLHDSDKKRETHLVRNVEMMVSDADVTSAHDIRSLAKRFKDKHNPNTDYQTPSSERILQMAETLGRQKVIERPNGTTVQLTMERTATSLSIYCQFNEWLHGPGQRVDLFEANGRCVFMSRVVAHQVIDEFGTGRLTELTFLRNRQIDVVENVIDDDHNMHVRAVHPIDSMDQEEFNFCLYATAVRANEMMVLMDGRHNTIGEQGTSPVDIKSKTQV